MPRPLSGALHRVSLSLFLGLVSINVLAAQCPQSIDSNDCVANERYNIGFYVGDNGESPIGGASCTFDSLQPVGDPIDLTGGWIP